MNKEEILIKDDEIDLSEVFRTLFDYKFQIIGVTICFMLLGVAYSFMATKWFKTTAIVEVGHTFNNNKKEYISDFSEFRGDVLANGMSIFDKNETNFKNLYVDNNLTDKGDNIEKSLGKGFYAISLVGAYDDKSVQKINEILKPIIISNRKKLEYSMMKKNMDLNILNKNINDTKDIVLEDAVSQIKTINEEAPKIDNKIEQITKILVEKDTKQLGSTYTTQIGGSDYGLSSLIQYRNNMITTSLSNANKKLYDTQMSLENLLNQKKYLEDDINEGFVDTKIVSIATTPEKNKNILIIAILSFIGLFVSIFGVLIYNIVKNIK
ncbi:Wzz/FepE/Etk N-terminal domain-containing protein [Campylobacter ureolyticus]|uniref:Wzz/FepE/Etk N-terminal domain-containing protein n=1 Tax=Campylobacter ureolyticus TaxID=827 RepID=UPI0029135E12|nr:Wzz/FepE/Etk N-terminal domain-containing protein [Campylobacter ureolyticus]MDU7070561.1 Wzz/FepE/Etk N-terminal domain-containing protein [Campylobacter ureolyticus]